MKEEKEEEREQYDDQGEEAKECEEKRDEQKKGAGGRKRERRKRKRRQPQPPQRAPCSAWFSSMVLISCSCIFSSCSSYTSRFARCHGFFSAAPPDRHCSSSSSELTDGSPLKAAGFSRDPPLVLLPLRDKERRSANRCRIMTHAVSALVSSCTRKIRLACFAYVYARGKSCVIMM